MFFVFMRLSPLIILLATFGIFFLLVSLPTFFQPQRSPEQLSEQQLIDDDIVLGNTSAPVLFVEFGDFLCHYCAQLHETVEPVLREKYVRTGKLKMVFRDFISPANPLGIPAAAAASCTQEQYWNMRDLLYQNVYKNDNWQEQKNVTEYFIRYAQQLGKDVKNCTQQSAVLQEIEQDIAQGLAINVIGTPTVFIGNEHKGFIRILSAQPLSVYEQSIENFLLD